MVDKPLLMRDLTVDGLNDYITKSEWFQFNQSDITHFRLEMQNMIGTLTEYYHNHRVHEDGRRILKEIILDSDSDDDDDVVQVPTVKKDRTESSEESVEWVWEERSDCSDESLASNYLPNSDDSYNSEYDSDNDLVADTTGNYSSSTVSISSYAMSTILFNITF